MRGGSWLDPASLLRGSARHKAIPTFALGNFGFRVATVPEPGTAGLALVACGLMWVLRKRLNLG